MTRDKPDSQLCCTIVGLSWPCGASINPGVQKYICLKRKFAMTYPLVDHIVNRLFQLRSGSLIYKIPL